MPLKVERLPPRAEDGIPDSAIRLSAAFARVHRAAKENPKVLASIPEWAQDNVLSMIDTLRNEDDVREPDDVSIEILVKAAALFRLALNDELDTYVRDPAHNQILILNHESWFFCDERVPVEFDDWLSMKDTPGPVNETILDGKRRPVFLDKAKFETWLHEISRLGSKPRKKRSGSYDIPDAPIVRKMRNLLVAGKVKSAWEAAGHCLGEAKGTGDPHSIQTRLRRAYYKKHPDIAPSAPIESDAKIT